MIDYSFFLDWIIQEHYQDLKVAEECTARFLPVCVSEMVSCVDDEQIRIVLVSLSDLVRFLFVDGKLEDTIRCLI